jgi:hypothetical protein
MRDLLFITFFGVVMHFPECPVDWRGLAILNRLVVLIPVHGILVRVEVAVVKTVVKKMENYGLTHPRMGTSDRRQVLATGGDSGILIGWVLGKRGDWTILHIIWLLHDGHHVLGAGSV